MYILGISCFYHDSAAALIFNGEVICAVEEERFTRIKHDSSFPINAINYCLKRAGITSDDLSFVVFYEKPFIKFERIFLNSFNYVPKSLSYFRESMKEWFFDKLWIKGKIVSELKITPSQLLFSEHHLSHIASSFYCSPFNEAAVLSIDGVGEWATITWGTGKNNKLYLKEEIRFPNSLGLLYSAFTAFAGFEPNDGEYKLMGLSPFGDPIYVEKIQKLIKTSPQGGFEINLDYFSFPYSLKEIYTKKFEKEFGRPNIKPDKVIKYYADMASSVQLVLEEQLLNICSYIQKETGLRNLCYAGGVALNSKANWRLLNETKFEKIFIQPAAGDSGGALGAALWVYHEVLGYKRRYVMKHAFLGFKEAEGEIKNSLHSSGVSYKTFKDDQKLIDYISDEIVKGKVIGWVQDESEWGPRALGHRSIIADPKSTSMKDKVNKKIKFREAFRPFAPSVLREFGRTYFDIGNNYTQYPFNFMLFVVPVKKRYQENLGAITHVDGTARPQIVNKRINPKYYALIEAFGKKTGVNALLNTSFNLKGEPIVNTTQDALKTFKKSGLDILVVNNFVIKK